MSGAALNILGPERVPDHVVAHSSATHPPSPRVVDIAPTHPASLFDLLPNEILAKIVIHFVPALYELDFVPHKWDDTLRVLEKAHPRLAEQARTVGPTCTQRYTIYESDEVSVLGDNGNIGFLHLLASAFPLDQVVADPPRFHGVHTVHVSDGGKVDLSVLAQLPNLSRLYIHRHTLEISTPNKVPTALIELTLLGIRALPAIVDDLVKRNSLLRIVRIGHVGFPSQFRNPYVPVDALASLPNLELFQFEGDGDPTTRAALLEPKLAELAPSLLALSELGEPLPPSIAALGQRVLIRCIDYPDDDGILIDKLVATSESLASMPHLSLVALPIWCDPSRLMGELAERLAANTLINACARRGVRVVWYDTEPRLAGEWMRTIYEALDDGPVSWGAPPKKLGELDEWPGWEAWDAQRAAQEASEAG
ncbi:hypothetical protein JCM10449v2_003315 [Rhodotorula kratochvilovae]